MAWVKCMLAVLFWGVGFQCAWSAYTITYPNGKLMADPGDEVLITFDEDISKYEFNTKKLEDCNNSSVKFLICSNPSACPAGSLLSVASRTENSLRVKIPNDYNKSTFDFYYGNRTNGGFWFVICYRYVSYVYKDFVTINVRTSAPTLRSTEKCFCPGSALELSAENFSGNKITLKYDDGKGHTGTKQITANGKFLFDVPSNVTGDLNFTCTVGKEAATLTVPMCFPQIVNVPDCAKNKTTARVTVENACPTITYELGGVKKTGSTTHQFDLSINVGSNDRSKTFDLKANGTVVRSLTIPICDITFDCNETLPAELSPEQGKCYVTIDDITKYISVSQSGGSSVTEKTYQYSEDNGTTFSSVFSSTVFNPGKDYIVRTHVYVDDMYVGYCDSKTFTIKANNYTASVNIMDGQSGDVYITSEDGTVNYGKSATVPCGTKVLYHAEPGACMKFDNWKYYENYWWYGTLYEPAVFEVVVDRNIEYRANFSNNGSYVVNAVSEDEAKGTVSIVSDGAEKSSGFTTGYCDQSVTFTARPATCHEFSRWSDGVTDKTRKIKVNKEIDLVAYFEEKSVGSGFEVLAGTLEQTACLGTPIQEVSVKSNSGTISFTKTGDDTGLTVTLSSDDKVETVKKCPDMGVIIDPHLNIYDTNLYVTLDATKWPYDHIDAPLVYRIYIYDENGELVKDSYINNWGWDQVGVVVPASNLDRNKIYTIKSEVANSSGSLGETCASNFSMANGGDVPQPSGKNTFTVSGTPEVAGDIVYTLSGGTCTSGAENVTIHVVESVVPELSSDDAVCKNSDLVIEETVGNTSDYTYVWSVDGGSIINGNGTNRITVNWATSGAKMVALTLTNKTTNCQSHVDKTITVNDLPEVSIAALPTSICPTIGTLDVTGSVTGGVADYKYVWNGDLTFDKKAITQTGASYTTHVTIPASPCEKDYPISLKVVDGNGCESNTATATISVKAPAAPVIVAKESGSDLDCDPASVPTLTVADFIVTDDCNVSASATVVSTDNVVGCNHTRTYTATYTNSCGVAATPVSVDYTWTVGEAPAIGAITVPAALEATNCQYSIPDLEAATLAASSDPCGGAVTFVGQSVAAGTKYTQTATAQNITVTVTVKSACNKTSTKDVVVVIPANDLNVTAPADVAICKGASVDLTATSAKASSYVWSPSTGLDNTNTAAVIATPTATTTYTVTVTDANGCTASDDVVVTVNPLVELSLSSASESVCVNSEINGTTITVANATVEVTGLPAGVTYSDNKISGTPSESGVYFIKVKATSDQEPKCNPIEETFTLTVYTLPTITAEKSDVTCKGKDDGQIVMKATSSTSPYTFSKNGGASFEGSSASSYTFNNLAPATYTIQAKDAHGCLSATKTVEITEPNVLTASVVAPAAGCPGTDYKFTTTVNGGTTPYTYAWSGNASGTSDSYTLSTEKACKSYSIKLEVTDAKGCKAEADDVTFTTVDTEAPAITGNLTELSATGCSESAKPAAYTTVAELEANGLTIADNCTADAYLVVTYSDVTTGSCPIVVTRTYTITDKCGNASTAQQTITINIDNTITITGGTSTKAVECKSDALVAPDKLSPSVMPTVTDACGNSIQFASVTSDASEFTGCEGTITYTYIYKDCANHTKEWNFVYTVDVPNLTIPQDGASIVPCVEDAVAPLTATVTDACGTNFTAVLAAANPVVNVTNGSGSVTYNYTYTDCAGTTYPWKYVYTITPETFEAPTDGSTTVKCKTSVVAPTLPVISVCGKTVDLGTPTETDEVLNGCGTYTYAYSYNVNGEDYTWNYVYTVSPDDFTMPAGDGETISCANSAVVPSADKLPVVKDACGRTLSPIGDPVKSENPACEGTITYTYTYKDCANHSHEWVYTYTIEKNAPVIASVGFATSSNISCIAEATEPTSVMIPSATNSCGTAVAPVMEKTTEWLAGKENCEGKIIYTYTYTDCGKSSTWSYTYNLKNEVAPTISTSLVSEDKGCNPTIVAPTKADFTVTDNCKAAAEVSISTPGKTNSGCAWSQTWTATYTNTCGVSASPISITYTWTEAEAPTISAIADQVAEKSSADCKYAMPDLKQLVLDATADQCGGLEFVSQEPAKGVKYDILDAEQIIPVTVKVKNGCGIEQTTTVNVVVPAIRPITVTSGSAEKLWDGTPLKKDDYVVDGELLDGDVLNVVVSGTITLPGVADNTFTYAVKRGGKDVSCEYKITPVYGQLTVECPQIVASKTDDILWKEKITLTLAESNTALSKTDHKWQAYQNGVWSQKSTNKVTYVYEFPDKYRETIKVRVYFPKLDCYSNEIDLTPAPCHVEWKGFVGDGVLSETSMVDAKNNPVTKYVVKAGSSYSLSFDNITNWKSVGEFKRSLYNDGADSYADDLNKSTMSNIKTQGNSYLVYSHDVANAQTSYKYRMKYTDCDGNIVWVRIFVEVKHEECGTIKVKANKPEGYVWGETVTMDLVSLDNGQYVTNYQWESSVSGIGWTPIAGATDVRYEFEYQKTSPHFYRLATPNYNCVSNVIELTDAPCSITWNGVKGSGVQLVSVDSVMKEYEATNYSRLENVLYTVPVGSRFEIGLDVVNLANAKYGIQKIGRRKADNSYGLNTSQKASNKDSKYYEDISPKDAAGQVIRDGVYVVEAADATYEYYLEYKDCAGATKKRYFLIRVIDECNSDNSEIVWYDNFGHFSSDGASYYQFDPASQTYREPISSYESKGKTYTVKFLNSREGYLSAVPDFNNAVVGHTFIMDTLKSSCPQCIIDGTYEILYNGKMISKDGRHWHNFTDHTGDDMGGMLLVNLAPKSKKIYEREFELSCNDAMVVLSCYLANANYNDKNDAGAKNDGYDPNIRLEILADGVHVGESYSGDICERDRYSEPWVNLTASFLGRKGVKYKMILHNNQTDPVSESGNDILIDDIMIKACYPQMILTEDPKVYDDKIKSMTICGTKKTMAAIYASCAGEVKKYFNTPYYFYQYRDKDDNWVDVPAQNNSLDSCVISVTDYPTGTKFRVIVAKDREMVDWVIDQYNQSTEPIEEDRYPKFECMHPYGVSTDFAVYYYPMLERLSNRNFSACYGEEKTLDIKDVHEDYVNLTWFDSEEFTNPLAQGVTEYTFSMDRPVKEHWFAVSGEDGVCPDTVKYVTKLNTEFYLDCGPELKLYIKDNASACSYVYKDKPTPNHCLPEPQYTYYYKLAESDEYKEWTEAGVELPLGANTIYWQCKLKTSVFMEPFTATCEQTLTVVDLVKPVISIVSNSDPEGACNPTTIVPPVFKALDNCDSSVEVKVSTQGPQGDGCEKTQVWTATASDAAKNAADEVDVTYTWREAALPTIELAAGKDNSYDLGCNPATIPTPDESWFEVDDNCNATAQATVTPGAETNDGCNHSIVYTATYASNCDPSKVAEPKTITITWREATVPTIALATGKSASEDLGCNPAVKPVPDASWFVVSDNCDATVQATVTPGAETNDGCNHSIVYTATYASNCDPSKVAEPKTITITWREATVPTIALATGKSASEDLGCNPAVKPVPDASWFVVSDNCDATVQATVTPGAETNDGCNHSIVYTATYASSCDPSKVAEPKTISYTWTEAEAPTISPISDVMAEAAGSCKYVMPNLESIVLAAATDNCGGTVTFVSQSIAEGEVFEQTNLSQTKQVVVTVKGTCNLSQTATVNVIIPANDLNVVASDDVAICKGSTASLTATSAKAVSYEWVPATGLDKTNVATVQAAPTATTTYTVTVTDANGCTASDDVVVTVNPLVELAATNLSQTVCANTAIDPVVITSANATVTTSALPVGLSFTDGKISGTPTTAGTYTVTITATSDQTPACEPQTKTFNLTVNPLVELAATNLTQTVCANSAIDPVVITSANATVTTSELPAGLSFAAGKISGTPTIAGTYTITITATSNQTPACDSQTETFSLTVNAKTLLTLSSTDDVICLGDAMPELTITSENATISTESALPAGLTLSADGTNISGTPTVAGVYTIKVVATNVAPSCLAETETYKLTVYAKPTLSAEKTDVSCKGKDDGQIVMSASSGTMPYKYSIDGGNTFASSLKFTDLAPTVYSLQVEDAHGCKSDIQTVEIAEPEVLTASISVHESFCYNTSDGVIEGSFVGGVSPYNLSWTDGNAVSGTQSNVTNINIENLPDGDYVVTVTDANGCHIDLNTTIAQLPQKITVTAKSAERPYDGSPLVKNEYEVTGALETGDEITNVVITGSRTDKGIETNKVESFRIMRGSKDVTCYYDTAMVAGTLEVTCKPLTITAGTKEFQYDGQSHTDPTYDVVGLVGDDAVTAVVEGTIKYVSESPVDNVLKSYEFTSGTADNYCIETVNGTLTMKYECQDIKVVANSGTWTYDGTTHTADGYELTIGKDGAATTVSVGADGTYTFTNGDVLTVDVAGSVKTVAESSVENIATVVSIKNGTVDVSNAYCITSEKGSLTITPAVLTIAVSDTKVYDGTSLVSPLAKATATGLVEGDELTAGVVTTNGKDVATYTYDATSAITTAYETKNGIGNYTVTYDLTQEITKRPITFTSSSAEKAYDGSELIKHEVIVSGDNFVSGEEVVFNVTGTRTEVGTSPNEFTYTFKDGTKAENYEVTKVEGTLTITASTDAIAIASASNTWTYDCANHTDETYTVTYGGEAVTEVSADGKTFTLPTGDKLTITSTAAGVKYYDATYANNNTFTYVLENAAQYTGATTTTYGTLSIDKKALTITAASDSKKYDGTALTKNSYTNSELASCDHIASVTVSGTITEIGTAANIASAAVIKDASDVDRTANYAITYVDGTLTITANDDAIAIASASNTWTYDCANHTDETYTVTYGGEAVTEVSADGKTFTLPTGDKLTITSTAAGVKYYDATYANNNTFTYVLENAAQYTGATTTTYGTLSIDKKALTITAESDAKKYDGTALTKNSYTNSELASCDHIASVTVSGTITEIGTAANLASAAVIKDASDVERTANYAITYVDGTLTITANDDAIAIASASNTWTYDCANHTDETYTVTYGGTTVTEVSADGKTFTLPTGDKLTITSTAAGVKYYDATYANNNTFTYVLENAAQYTGATTTTYGTLSIDKKALTITAADATKKYDGTALTKNSYTNSELASCDHIASVTVSGTITEIGTAANLASAAVIKDASDVERTENYAITYVNGTLTITANDDAIAIASASNTWTYDCANHTDETYTVTYGGEAVTEVSEDGKTFILPTGDKLTITSTAAGVKYYDATYANNNTFTYVLENATQYTGEKTTTYGTLSIEKKALTITADDATKKYDGTSLTKNSYTNSELASCDHIASVTVVGTITEIGTAANVASAAVIKDASDVDRTANYAITYVNGTLTITANDDAIAIASASNTWTYDCANHTDETYTVTYGGEAVTEVSADGKTFTLPTGDKLTITSTAAGVKYYDATYANNNTFTYELENAAQYTGATTTTFGTLSIDKKALTITAASDSKKYDGTSLTKDAYTNGVLASCDHIASVTVVGTITEIGEEANLASAAVIKDASDVERTANYAITYVDGTLTITANDDAIAIASASNTWTYDC
ncbi:MAG: putative Ig domain-containing protein, partial [Paludibacteraceae bacterium]|nr:putative Ig domain-containing protein [Paludibacteraceae bacterium]